MASVKQASRFDLGCIHEFRQQKRRGIPARWFGIVFILPMAANLGRGRRSLSAIRGTASLLRLQRAYGRDRYVRQLVGRRGKPY